MTQQAVLLQSTTPLTLDQTAKDVLVVTKVADLVVNLPPSNHATRGKRVTLTVETLSAALGASLEPNGTDTIYGTDITASAGKYVKNTHATEAVGDTLAVVADGSGGWRIVSKIGTWAREA